jgi:hypothetical protein
VAVAELLKLDQMALQEVLVLAAMEPHHLSLARQ